MSTITITQDGEIIGSFNVGDNQDLTISLPTRSSLVTKSELAEILDNFVPKSTDMYYKKHEVDNKIMSGNIVDYVDSKTAQVNRSINRVKDDVNEISGNLDYLPKLENGRLNINVIPEIGFNKIVNKNHKLSDFFNEYGYVVTLDDGNRVDIKAALQDKVSRNLIWSDDSRAQLSDAMINCLNNALQNNELIKQTVTDIVQFNPNETPQE